MFRCTKCNKVSKPGEKCFLAPSETRPKTYYLEYGKVSEGWETVREERVCADCYEKYLDYVENLNKEMEAKRLQESKERLFKKY